MVTFNPGQHQQRVIAWVANTHLFPILGNCLLGSDLLGRHHFVQKICSDYFCLYSTSPKGSKNEKRINILKGSNVNIMVTNLSLYIR